MRRNWFVVLAAVAAVTIPASPASADGLNAYRVEGHGREPARARGGRASTSPRDGISIAGTIDFVATDGQTREAGRRSSSPTTGRRQGREGRRRPDRRRETTPPTTVWTKYDAVADDEKEQYTEQYERLVADHPDIVADAGRRAPPTAAGTSSPCR